MDYSRMIASPPPKIVIVAKEEEGTDISSSILEHFKSSQKKQADPSPQATQVPSNYSPYISNVVKAFESPQPAESVAGKRAAQVEEMVYVKAPVDDSTELKVFKHKEVNSLIRNRILSLESSIANKTIEKKQLQEVDQTIKAVVKVEESERMLEELKQPREEQVLLPTSKIRELAQSMQSSRPKFEINIPILQPKESESESETEEESEEESEDESEDEEEMPVLTQAILKEPEPPMPLKPILTKQYSFNMDKKFHEERDDDGWKKVKDISVVSSSSESEDDDEEVRSIPPAPPQPPTPVQKANSFDYSHANYRDGKPRQLPETDYTSDSSVDDKRVLEKRTVERILKYDSEIETQHNSLFETFEDYVRRRNEEVGVDPDLQKLRLDYDSEYGSDYTEYTNANDNESFINQDYNRSVYYTDTDSEDSRYTYDSGNPNGEYYSDSVFEDGYREGPSEKYSYYSSESDDRTLVDESEFEGRRRGYDPNEVRNDDELFTDDYTDYSTDYTSEYTSDDYSVRDAPYASPPYNSYRSPVQPDGYHRGGYDTRGRP